MNYTHHDEDKSISEDLPKPPFYKRKHKYYTCECGAELQVTSRLETDRYGVLEYMRCKVCNERMVAQDDNFLGLAAR
jgi:predicted SprT family Zn-dependent metalloprotease